MYDDFTIKRVPMSVDDALAALIETHRQATHSDPDVDETAELSFEMTVAHWCEAMAVMDRRKLPRRLNELFDLRVPEELWDAVLNPPKQRRLRDVCELIARHAQRDVVEPVTVLGHRSEAAGAFLVVRAMLREAGADVSTLSPSSELSPFLASHMRVFVGRVPRLAPGALPPVTYVPRPLEQVLTALTGVLWLASVALWWFSRPTALRLVGIWVLSFLLLHVVCRVAPGTIRFDKLRTFRELAQVLARERTGAFPVVPVAARSL